MPFPCLSCLTDGVRFMCGTIFLRKLQNVLSVLTEMSPYITDKWRKPQRVITFLGHIRFHVGNVK